MNRGLTGLQDRLVASDPERARLRGAVRAWLTAAIGAAVLLGIARLLQQPANLALIGVVVPLMSAVAVQDPSVAQQRTTMLLVPVVAAPAIWLGAWLHDMPLAAGAVFLLVIVAGFEGRRFGARGAALGMIAYLAYVYALLLQPDAGNALAVLGFLLARHGHRAGRAPAHAGPAGAFVARATGCAAGTHGAAAAGAVARPGRRGSRAHRRPRAGPDRAAQCAVARARWQAGAAAGPR